MTRLIGALRREEGQGIVQALLLLAGVLLPLMFLVALFGRIEQGRLAAEQTARDAVRAASQAPSQTAAEQAANDALARAQQQTGLPMRLTLQGNLHRGGSLTATSSVEVSLAELPFFGQLGTTTIHAQARAPVDQYRSLDPSAEARP
jgi:Flp pilus assembly protein TadG